MDYAQWAKEAREVDENAQGTFEEVPAGSYECAIKLMEHKVAKSGKDMISIRWEILEGDQKGRLMFQNVVLSENTMGLYKKFMQSIKTTVDVFGFTNQDELKEMIDEVFEDVTSKCEYQVQVKDGRKGFKEYEITDIYNI